MTLEILLVLALLIAAVFLFTTEWLSVDVVTLLLLMALIVFGILTPEEAFSGFANEIIVILASIFVLSGALMKTGIMEWLASWIEAIGGKSPARMLIFLMLLTAFASAFMNNTTVTAMFLPAVIGVSRRSKISPSRLLIPLAFASMLGGTCTLIGTSTNIAGSGFILRSGLEPFSLFEFLPIGAAITALGIIYMSFLGVRLLPETQAVSYVDQYEIRGYLSELLILEDSPIAGQTIQDSRLAKLGLTVLQIIRAGEQIYPETHTVLQSGDLLIVQATREALLQIKELPGIEIHPDVRLGEKLARGKIKMMEAIVMPRSFIVGRTIRELNFRRRFGVTVMAIYRRGHVLAIQLAGLRLRVGDVLLLQGRAEQFETIWGSPDLRILEEIEHLPFRKRKGIYTILALIAALILGGLDLLPLSAAFLAAALAAVLLKCISIEDAYNFMDWRLLILIAGMTSFGVAMEKSGAAEYSAGLIVGLTEPYGVYAVLAGFMAVTMILTQPMSNASAALVVLPVALHTAGQMGLEPRTFAVLVTLSASLSFITPFEPSCLLVYGPGKYRFRDFVISGFPLTVLTFFALLFLIPRLWPL